MLSNLTVLLTLFINAIVFISCENVKNNIVIPKIDISLFANGTLEEKKNIAHQIGLACENVGFFTIVNHGINKDVISNAWDKTKEFFDLSIDEKSKYLYPQTEYPYGYTPLNGEILSSGKSIESNNNNTVINKPDLKEMFSIGPSDPKAGFPPRRFPDIPVNFDLSWTNYYNEVSKLASIILKAFAIELNLNEDFFESYITHHASAMRALNYPSLDGYTIENGQLRASAHTDYGAITVLRSDGPGLQVSKDTNPPVWYDVPYDEDGFIVNLGDLMKRWTNDKWLSTLHRVVFALPEDVCLINNACNNTSIDLSLTRRRQSIAYFQNLNKDAVVTVLSNETPKYPPIIAGDFLMQKHLASILN